MTFSNQALPPRQKDGPTLFRQLDLLASPFYGGTLSLIRGGNLCSYIYPCIATLKKHMIPQQKTRVKVHVRVTIYKYIRSFYIAANMASWFYPDSDPIHPSPCRAEKSKLIITDIIIIIFEANFFFCSLYSCKKKKLTSFSISLSYRLYRFLKLRHVFRFHYFSAAGLCIHLWFSERIWVWFHSLVFSRKQSHNNINTVPITIFFLLRGKRNTDPPQI